MGIGPGLAAVGYGIVEREAGGRKFIHIAHGVIKTSSRSPTPTRLLEICDALRARIEEFAVDETSVEELFFASNAKTALSVAQARGVAILASAQAGTPVAEYSALSIKQAVVGYGRADKRQVQQMVKVLLGLEEIPKPDHAADALAAALCHLHQATPLAQARKQASKNHEGPQSGPLSPNKALLMQRRPRRSRR